MSVSAWLWRYFILCYKLLLRVDDISCHSVNSSRNQISTNYLPTHLSQWIHWAKRRHKCYIFIIPVYTIVFSEINDNKDLYRHAVKICCQVNIRKLNINIILMWYLMQKWNIKFKFKFISHTKVFQTKQVFPHNISYKTTYIVHVSFTISHNKCSSLAANMHITPASFRQLSSIITMVTFQILKRNHFSFY